MLESVSNSPEPVDVTLLGADGLQVTSFLNVVIAGTSAQQLTKAVQVVSGHNYGCCTTEALE